jgi:hypothetical protein
MAISRFLMNRQLRADGGIMQVAPREKFGFGSKLKKFVRKIIPNEVAEVAVKAAPFVAPFNPAVAAAMSGIGSFDQTGRIGDSLKSGALTYGLGQGARYLGGAELQGNPFKTIAGDPTSGAFRGGLEGFKGGFSSPLGNQSGFKLGKPVEEVQSLGVNIDTTGPLEKQIGDKTFGQKVLDLGKKAGKAIFYDSKGNLDRNVLLGAIVGAASYMEAKALADEAGVDLSEQEYNDLAYQAEVDAYQKEQAKNFENFFEGKKDGGRIGFKSGYSPGIVSAALEEYNSVYGTDSSGEEILVKDLYSGGFEEFLEIYTGDAYEKRANGGRIGFESGGNEMIKEKLMMELGLYPSPEKESSGIGLYPSPEEESSGIGLYPSPITEEDSEIIMTKDGPVSIKEIFEKDTPLSEDLLGMSDGFTLSPVTLLRRYLANKELENKANGGRIGYARGSKPEDAEIGIMTIDVEAGGDEDEEDMMMAGITFSRPEKSYLFRRLGGSGGAERSFTMPQLYRILNNPNKYPDDAAVLKEIAIMGLGEGQKDGGRIGYVKGGNRVSELLILRDGLLANGEDVSNIEAEIFQLTGKTFKSVGGISDIPTGKMRKNNAGVVERDYRDEGGFVPVGIKERADDVPAMLSKNEFVMTADAVRGIGNGSVEEGSKKLYNTMKQAEKVGKA